MQERRSHCASFVRIDTKTRRGLIDNFLARVTPNALTRFDYLKSSASRRRGGPANAKLQSDPEPFLLKSVADFGEHGADLSADRLDGGDNEDRDQRCDQRILDRGSPRFVDGEVLHGLEHWLLLLRNPIQRPTQSSMPPDTERKYPSSLSTRLIRISANETLV